MSGMTKKSFSTPDQTRSPDKTLVQEVSLGGGIKAARFTMEPGWRWSQCISPIAGTERCQVRHIGAMITGNLHLSCDDGTEVDLGPGDAYVIEPGHDAWVLGDKPVVAYEFNSEAADTYATPGS
jgi:uncharacterized cupin superfamily protein